MFTTLSYVVQYPIDNITKFAVIGTTVVLVAIMVQGGIFTMINPLENIDKSEMVAENNCKTSENSLYQSYICEYSNEITAASEAYQVERALVGAVLADEIERYNLLDRMQENGVRLLLEQPRWVQTVLLRPWDILAKQMLERQSFGPAQMNIHTLDQLIEGGYITPPAAGTAGKLALLIDKKMAPALVAARLRQTADYWNENGVKIGERPDILGTLYSIGLTGIYGVHTAPQPNWRGEKIAASAVYIEDILLLA